MLGWASRYREVERQNAQMKAGEMAAVSRRAERALVAARDERDEAASQWMRTIEDGGRLDLMAGQYWKAEYVRRDQAQRDALVARDHAQGELEAASAYFQQKNALTERSLGDFYAAKRKGAKKRDERRLQEVAELFVLKGARR